jgi:hypothetical protein
MSRSSTASQLLIYVSAQQWLMAMAEIAYMPLSAGLLYGIFIS